MQHSSCYDSNSNFALPSAQGSSSCFFSVGLFADLVLVFPCPRYMQMSMRKQAHISIASILIQLSILPPVSHTHPLLFRGLRRHAPTLEGLLSVCLNELPQVSAGLTLPLSSFNIPIQCRSTAPCPITSSPFYPPSLFWFSLWHLLSFSIPHFFFLLSFSYDRT